jgi:lipoyl(octanoyl) transferase
VSKVAVLISVIQLGTVDYATGLRLQQKLVDLRKADKIGDTLLLLEHTPVITLGRNAKQSNIVASPELLKQRGVEVFECDRGGDVTYHGPGQLVGYPIFDLRAQSGEDGQCKTVGAVEYVRRVEEALIRTCAEYGIATERVKGMTGVWTSASSETGPDGGGAGATQAKIAAIGVHISRAVTSHGFALNVNTDLDYFKLIVPCGITTKPVTSIHKEIGRELALDEVAQVVARNFGRVFNSQILWLETLDALLGSVVGVPMKEPRELRRLHGDDSTWA